MVNSVVDLDNLLVIIVLGAMRVMNVKASSLLLKDSKSDKLYFHTCIGDQGEEIKKFELARGEGIAGWVAERGEPVLVTDVTKDPRWSQKIAETLGLSTKSMACAPLKVGDEVLGVLQVIDRLSEEPLDKNDLARLQALSELAAGLLLKARIYKEVALENTTLKRELGGKYKIIGNSVVIQKALDNCEKVADSNVTVLITGESGTGKELFARLIHKFSERQDKPMITVNCGALPETLLERELFGHEKEAFTGADTQKPGLFEAADTGTIFLDEIGETSQAMQVKLLRVLQEGTFFRLGGQELVHVDARVIAATNKDLGKLVKGNGFREDLYYRLNVVNIHLPPLRERGKDLSMLADYFLNKFTKELNRPAKKIEPAAMRVMEMYSWPGNIRQLENMIERAVIMGESDLIGLDDLPPELTEASEPTLKAGITLKEAQDSFRRKFVSQSLDHCNGNKTETAKMLGIQRTYLSRLIKELGIT